MASITDPRRDWSEPIQLMDGLSYRWRHGERDTIKVEIFGTPKADGSDGAVQYGAFDWRSIRGYLSYGHVTGHPSDQKPLIVKVNDQLLKRPSEDLEEGWCSGSAMPSSFFPTGSTGNAVASVYFDKQPGAWLEPPSSPIFLHLDAEGVAFAESQRLSSEQIDRKSVV